MPTKRLLVVDDEEKICTLMKACLEPEYDVSIASDGAEALRLAHRLLPQGILLDIGLPEMDGLSVLKALKLSAKTVQIPVIMLSARGESDALLDARALGACDYLIKPVKMDEVRDTVHRYI